jgi:formylmethanofuran dehydrogenase subunit C
MLELTLRAPSNIPLEVDGILPEKLANLSPTEVAKLPVQHGNRTEPLGEFFDVATASGPGDLRFAGDLRNVKLVGAGLTAGSVYCEGPVGMHAGARMSGGSLTLDSDAGDWLGAEMRGGFIEVRGTAGDQVGAAYRGSRRGMTGGTILVRGSAGDELGLLMRRGLIAVCGDCGAFAGASLIAGTLALLGECGPQVGAGMKRGTIVCAREPRLPASFAFSCEYRPSFLPLYLAHLAALGAAVPPGFGGAVRCFRGDLLTGGKGEVLVAAG